MPLRILIADPIHEIGIEFLQQHEDIWTQWVPSGVADKVKSAL